MTEEKRAEVSNWLIKSRHDLGSARRLMQGDEPYLDTAVYHCQQAAEKALKAFLTCHDVSFERTHDLSALLELCIAVEPSCEQWRDIAEELSPYAVRFRYPSSVLEPERSEAETALEHARHFVEFILRLLARRG
ncbi:MAG: HEPN domain-containing protein [Candidatus Binatia bacterium]